MFRANWSCRYYYQWVTQSAKSAEKIVAHTRVQATQTTAHHAHDTHTCCTSRPAPFRHPSFPLRKYHCPVATTMEAPSCRILSSLRVAMLLQGSQNGHSPPLNQNTVNSQACVEKRSAPGLYILGRMRKAWWFQQLFFLKMGQQPTVNGTKVSQFRGTKQRVLRASRILLWGHGLYYNWVEKRQPPRNC
jgi:hypothetical protein